MSLLPQHLWLDARLAWPRGETRASLTLPKEWRKGITVNDATEFDEFDSSGYAERKEKEEQGYKGKGYEAKVKRGWELKNKQGGGLGEILASELFEACVDALLSDTKSWYCALRGKADDEIHEATWLAQELVCWLYDINAKAVYASAPASMASEAWNLLCAKNGVSNLSMPKDFEAQFTNSKSSFPIDSSSLSYWACEARKRRNNFFTCFPEMRDEDYIKASETEKVETNPDGSVDFWTAVQAFKARSFLQHEGNVVWYERVAFDKADDMALALEEKLAGPTEGEIAAWRNVWIQAMLLREAASVGVVIAAAQASTRWPDSTRHQITPTRIRRLGVNGLDRLRTNPTTDAPGVLIFYILRVIMTFIIALRNTMKEVHQNSILEHYSTLEKCWFWACTRQPSMLALCCNGLPHLGRILLAMGRFENAIMMEHWALVHLLRCLQPNDEAEHMWYKAGNKQMALASLALRNADPRFLWHGVDDKWRKRCEEIFVDAPPELRTPTCLASIMTRGVAEATVELQEKDRHDALNSVCCFLATHERLSACVTLCATLEHEAFAALQNPKHWHLPLAVDMSRMTSLVQHEDMARQKLALDMDGDDVDEVKRRTNDPFEGSPFTPTTIKILCKRAEELGYE